MDEYSVWFMFGDKRFKAKMYLRDIGNIKLNILENINIYKIEKIGLNSSNYNNINEVTINDNESKE